MTKCPHCFKNIEQRTEKQNNSLHKFCAQLANELNEKGLTVQEVLSVELDWTPQRVKEILWKETQKKLFHKESTTELSKNEEIDMIYDHLNRGLIKNTNGEVSCPPWPSMDTLEDTLDNN